MYFQLDPVASRHAVRSSERSVEVTTEWAHLHELTTKQKVSYVGWQRRGGGGIEKARNQHLNACHLSIFLCPTASFAIQHGGLCTM